MKFFSRNLPEAVKQKLPPEEKKRLGIAAMTMDELITRQSVRTERDLQNQIADYLRLRGVPFYRSRMDKRTTSKLGTPDFLICVASKFLALEAKRDGEEPTPEQVMELDAIRAAGGIALIVTKLEQVKIVLDELVGSST